jgi:hypothetical protein
MTASGDVDMLSEIAENAMMICRNFNAKLSFRKVLVGMIVQLEVSKRRF